MSTSRQIPEPAAPSRLAHEQTAPSRLAAEHAPPSRLTTGHADRFAGIALGHVTREYPHITLHVLTEPVTNLTPAGLHPVFHGSYDWHSCVHSYWLLARVLRRYPDGETAARITALFDERLTPEGIAGEVAFFERPTSRSFERPYGWAWLLKLAGEVMSVKSEADGRLACGSSASNSVQAANAERWARALSPLAELISDRFRDFLPRATYPIRVGTHGNTAFALRLAADYAEAVADEDLAVLLRETALRWYGNDVACPAWGEPGGSDFLSPALAEAECMRRLLPTEDFLPWFRAFLPGLESGEPANLFVPATVSDRSDGQIAHLDGLNLSRAWCFDALAAALPAGDGLAPVLQRAAARHLEAALPHLEADYMGEHWLATFALLAFEPGT